MFEQHFFIHGAYFGKVQRSKVRIHEHYGAPDGKAFFCPICAEVWALCPVTGQPTSVLMRPCEKHVEGEMFGDWSHGHVTRHSSAGSVLVDYDPEWMKALPKEVLAREFLRLYVGQ